MARNLLQSPRCWLITQGRPVVWGGHKPRTVVPAPQRLTAIVTFYCRWLLSNTACRWHHGIARRYYQRSSYNLKSIRQAASADSPLHRCAEAETIPCYGAPSLLDHRHSPSASRRAQSPRGLSTTNEWAPLDRNQAEVAEVLYLYQSFCAACNLPVTRVFQPASQWIAAAAPSAPVMVSFSRVYRAHPCKPFPSCLISVSRPRLDNKSK